MVSPPEPMLYPGLPGGRVFFTMLSTVSAIKDNAGVSAWMVSALRLMARIVTGMDIHLHISRRGKDKFISTHHYMHLIQ